MSELININSKSFKKMIFHSLKFLTNDTIGILVGSLQENKIFLVEDVYPLTHLRVTLPFLETAISLIQTHLNHNQQIIGVYESITNDNADIQSDKISEATLNIALSFSNQNKQNAIIVKLKSQKNNDLPSIQAFFLNSSKQLKPIDNAQINNNQVKQSEIFDNLLQNIHLQIIDFDQHFEECSLDFRNRFIQ